MSDLSSLTSAQFKRAAEIKGQIEALSNELATLLGSSSTPAPIPAKRGRPRKVVEVPKSLNAAPTPHKRRKMSAAARAKIAAAQKVRWAKVKGAKVDVVAEPGVKSSAPKNKRKMSAEGRARLIAAQKARWAKFHAEKKA
jgi:hypothetical protein